MLEGISAPYQVKLVRGPRQGPAAARNRALPLASTPLVLFINDDTRLSPTLLETHVELHSNSNDERTAWVGAFEFPPELRESPLLRAAEDLGLLHTRRLAPGDRLGPLDFCTGNVSVPLADVLEVGGFDPTFPEAAGEDLDLGLRLCKQRDMKVRFRSEARAWHEHPHTLSQWWERCRSVGRAMRRLAEKHGDACLWPGGESVKREAIRNPDFPRRRLAAGALFAHECIGWTERVVEGQSLSEVHLSGVDRPFRLPEETDALLRVTVAVSSFYVQKRAFWEDRLTEPFLQETDCVTQTVDRRLRARQPACESCP